MKIFSVYYMDFRQKVVILHYEHIKYKEICMKRKFHLI